MINHSDILQLCRLCLVEEQVNNPIFEETGNLQGILYKITSCLPVSISKDDCLPKKICETCTTKIDEFYKFWSETSNSEKQLHQWLSNKTSNIKNKMDSTEIKQELDLDDGKLDTLEMSSEAQTYILQQQQLPYTSSSKTISSDSNDIEEPASKRPRRASAMKALEHLESDDDDDEDDEDLDDNFAKAESGDSDKDDEDNYQEGPSTSMDDQPGPSGVGKTSTEAPLSSTKPCVVRLNEVKQLLNVNNIYKVPPRRLRGLTCYICSLKFDSQEELNLHKIEHESGKKEEKGVESTSEPDFGTDSDTEAYSEYSSDDIELFGHENSISSPKIKKNESLRSRKNLSISTPISSSVNHEKSTNSTKIKKNESRISSVIESDKENNTEKETSYKKVTPIVNNDRDKRKSINNEKNPAINNISIKCKICDLVFTNSEQLKQHKPKNPSNPCAFQCKVCQESYSTPVDYLDHIMKHNAFSTKSMQVKVTNSPTLDSSKTIKKSLPTETISVELSDDDSSVICETPNVQKDKSKAVELKNDSAEISESPKEKTNENKKVTPLKLKLVPARLEEKTKSTSSNQSSKLICDLCFDIFTDIQSLEEHMEFHNNLNSKSKDNNSKSNNNDLDSNVQNDKKRKLKTKKMKRRKRLRVISDSESDF